LSVVVSWQEATWRRHICRTGMKWREAAVVAWLSGLHVSGWLRSGPRPLPPRRLNNLNLLCHLPASRQRDREGHLHCVSKNV